MVKYNNVDSLKLCVDRVVNLTLSLLVNESFEDAPFTPNHNTIYQFTCLPVELLLVQAFLVLGLYDIYKFLYPYFLLFDV